MKKTQLLYFFLNFLIIILPVIASAQQKVQSFNLQQKTAFIENKGQLTDQNGIGRKDVKFLYSAPNLKVVLKKNSFSYEVFTLKKNIKPGQQTNEANAGQFTINSINPQKGGRAKNNEEIIIHSERIDIEFIGANAESELIAEEKNSDYRNYYLAHTPEKGITNVYSYNKLTYKNLYPKIDLVFYAKEEGVLKYDIVVHPGGKLEDVKMKYNGSAYIKIEDESLLINTSQGSLKEVIPYSFLKENNTEIKVKHLLKDNQVSFVASYNNQKTLVIDPKLYWGMYYGGSENDRANDIKVIGNNTVYLAGYTLSSSNIASSGAHQTTYGGNSNEDAFLVKLNTGGIMAWATYYGGDGGDEAKSINTDLNGNVYITGWTVSTSAIATSGAHQTTIGGGSYGDCFVAKFNINGVRQWGTYYGGSSFEQGYGICIDSDNNLYFSGNSSSTSGIATPGAFMDVKIGAATDAFVVKFNSNGVRQWGTYYGGGSYEDCTNIASDSKNNIYIVGDTRSSTGIATTNTHQSSFSNGNYGDAYLVKFDSKGNRQWGTYYGGTEDDSGYDITVDGEDNLYLTGITQSLSGIATIGTHQTIYGGGTYDAFVCKFNNSGTRLWSTYYGGSDWDAAVAINTDINGFVYITGYTSSTNGINVGGWKTHNGGTYDAFLAKFSGIFCNGMADVQGVYTVCNNDINIYKARKGLGFSYEWNVIGGDVIYGDETDSIVVKWNSPGQGSVKLVVSISLSCKDSVIKSVTVNPKPKAFTGPLRAVCLGDSIKIGSASVAGNIYSWTSKPIGFVSSASENFVSPKVTTTYYLTETITSTGCTKTDSVTIQSKPLPQANFIAGKICLGKPVYFTNTSTNDYSYIWDFGDGNKSIIWNPSNTYKAAGQYNVKLIVTSLGGCKDTVTKIINVEPLPVPDFNYSDVCIGENSYFTNFSTGATSYQWNFGDGNTSILKNPVHKFLKPGTYNVKLKATNSLSCTDSVINVVTVFPLPKAVISVNKDTGTTGRNYIFNNLANTAQSFWNFGDGNTANGNSVKHTFQKDGAYKITLSIVDNNGCKNIADTNITIITTSTSEAQFNSGMLNIYPNPFSYSTNLVYHLKEMGNVEISVYDLAGKEIAVLEKGLQHVGKHIVTINADKYQLKASVYILKVKVSNQIISRQLIKLNE